MEVAPQQQLDLPAELLVHGIEHPLEAEAHGDPLGEASSVVDGALPSPSRLTPGEPCRTCGGAEGPAVLDAMVELLLEVAGGVAPGSGGLECGGLEVEDAVLLLRMH